MRKPTPAIRYPRKKLPKTGSPPKTAANKKVPSKRTYLYLCFGMSLPGDGKPLGFVFSAAGPSRWRLWEEQARSEEFPRSPSSALLPFFWGEPTKIDYRKKGTVILTFLLEDPVSGSLGL